MKSTTQVWARFESIGKPDESKEMSGTVKEVIFAMSQWLLNTYMGSRIQVTISRTREELNSNKADKIDHDMHITLAAMLAAESNNSDD